MRINTTYTNEFTGEVFTDMKKCEQAEKESKKYFIVELMGQLDTIKDICNNSLRCEYCPLSFNNEAGDPICSVSPFVDNYLDIVAKLHKVKTN